MNVDTMADAISTAIEQELLAMMAPGS